jgi:hypothetical protein
MLIQRTPLHAQTCCWLALVHTCRGARTDSSRHPSWKQCQVPNGRHATATASTSKRGHSHCSCGSAKLPHKEQTRAHSTDITATPTTSNQPKLHDVHNTHAKLEKRIMQPPGSRHQPLDSLYTTMHGTPHKQHEERRL